VYAVSSTTTNKTQIGKNFGDGNEDKIWNFEVVSYFWILNLVMILLSFHGKKRYSGGYVLNMSYKMTSVWHS
jgi:hypothetical protein